MQKQCRGAEGCSRQFLSVIVILKVPRNDAFHLFIVDLPFSNRFSQTLMCRVGGFSLAYQGVGGGGRGSQMFWFFLELLLFDSGFGWMTMRSCRNQWESQSRYQSRSNKGGAALLGVDIL